VAEVQPKHVLLRVGGRVLQRYGVPAVYGAGRGRVEVPYVFTRADAATCATYVDRDGLIRKAAANVLRVEWVDLDGDGIRETPGLLMEGGRQNLMLRSEEIDNAAWSKTTVTFGANADVAPDGTTTADRLIEGALSQEHVVYQTLTATADVRHSVSVFAKAGTRSFVYLTIRDVNGLTNGVLAWFNLATGAVGTVSHNGAGSGEQAFIQKLANGWYRCTLIGACNNGDTTPLGTVGISSGNGTTVYTGDGSSYISVWGAQFENNTPFPSSYIPTVASAVARAADSLNVSANFGNDIELTVGARLGRPVHADVSGSLGINPSIYQIGDTNGNVRGVFTNASRLIEATVDGPGSDMFPNAAIVAGAQITYVAQYKNLRTVPAARIDLGAGLPSYGTGAGAMPNYTSQNIGVGANLFAPLIDEMFLRGQFTLAEYLAVP